MNLLGIAQLITNALRLDAPSVDIPAGVDWPRLVHHADGHSLTPLLYDTWRQASRLDRLPPEIRARIARAYADNVRRNQNVKADLLDVDRILSDAGVPHVVLKGWPLVEQLYTDPAHRVLYDHDILVPAEVAQIGHQALAEAGFVPLPAKDEWVEKHLTPVWRNQGFQWDGYLFDPNYPRPVELHVNLWEDGWRGLRVDPLPDPWRDTRTITVAGRPMRLLSVENTLVHLAVHFVGHLIEREARLNQLLDLARFVEQEANGLNWGRVLAQARGSGVTRFVCASLWLAHNIFGVSLPPNEVQRQLIAGTPPGFFAWLAHDGLVDVLTSDYRCPHPGQDYRLTFMAASSLRERIGIVRFALFPPLGQLVNKYNLPHPWLGPLYYPRYVWERIGVYSRGMFGKPESIN